MKILFFCPRWGSENVNWDSFCKKVKDKGFDGIEAPVPIEPELKDEMFTTLTKYGLQLVGQYYQSFEKDFNEHKVNYEKHLRHLISANL